MNSNNFQQHLTLAVVGGVVVMALMEMKGQHSRLWHHARYTGPLHIELVLIGIGAVFKIEHWFFANAQFLVGGLLAVGTYSLWLKAKEVKSLISCLKFAFVLSIGVSILTLVFWSAWIELMSGFRKILILGDGAALRVPAMSASAAPIT